MSDEEMESSEQESGAASQDAAYAREFNEGLNERKLTARQQAMLDTRKSKATGAISAAKQAEELAARLRKIQKIWRTVNVVSGVSLLGLIITFVSMNLQLIFGNVLKVRFVPPLHVVEILILGIVYFIISIEIIFYLAIFTFLAGCVSSPTGALTCAGKVIEEVTSVVNTAPIQQSIEAGIDPISGMVAD